MFIHSGPNRGGLHTTIVQTNGIRFTKKAYFTSTPTGKTLLAKLPSGTSVAGSERRSATGTSSSMIQWQGGTSPMATVVKTILFVATAHAAPTWRGGPYGETTSPMADRMTDYLLGH